MSRYHILGIQDSEYSNLHVLFLKKPLKDVLHERRKKPKKIEYIGCKESGNIEKALGISQ